MANTNANKYLGAGLGLLLLSFCFMAGAEDLTGTAWDLDTLQKQRVLYEAQAAVKKAQAEAEGVGGKYQHRYALIVDRRGRFGYAKYRACHTRHNAATGENQRAKRGDQYAWR